MLRRIISLAIVCAGLLVAGAPAFACTPEVPLTDCCPSGPGGPCRAPNGFAIRNSVACCAAGIVTPAAAASMSLPTDRAVRRSTGNPPAAIDSFVLAGATGWRQFAPSFDGQDRAYRPSGSVLYLSTGRLRL